MEKQTPLYAFLYRTFFFQNVPLDALQMPGSGHTVEDNLFSKHLTDNDYSTRVFQRTHTCMSPAETGQIKV